ncbi:non sense mediated decay family [Hyphodiscus hymeniophilus]|uniref:Non sense mediated decay family n=1 Tax=Hyphodiscus hymeniophilus TaxID=353542 RepID=A0A9P6VKV8_9HELO|nr:non sense mediated decay family [Hyphodiscus hymeniophilus]
MHYIRFLKPPRPLITASPASLSAKITVTTDLGESFLLSNVSLVVELEFKDGTSVLGEGKGREFVWKGRDGMRALEILIQVPVSKGGRKIGSEMVRMLVGPKEDALAVDSFRKILDMQHQNDDSGEIGGIVPIRSMAIDINPGAKRDDTPGVGMAQRVFSMGSGNSQKGLRIWEETGESIARHIWDAGLVFSSCLAFLSLSDSTRSLSHAQKLPILKKALQRPNLRVLELGAGCGIVGITLASSIALHSVLLSDLPAASSILSRNLSTLPLPIRPKLSSQVLDWSSSLPSNVASTRWDLVLVADCTYNPDVVPDLVATLGRIVERRVVGKETLVALAMKVRHESEMVFFDLMRERGFVVRETIKIPLPVLGGEREEIEIFVFAYRD